MRRLNLRLQFISFLLVPVSLLIVAIAIIFSYEKIHDLQNSLQQKGISLINQIMPAAKFGIYINSNHMLQDVTNAVLQGPDIRAIGIYDKNGQTLAYAGPEFLERTRIEPTQKEIKVLDDANLLEFVAPIIKYTPENNLVEYNEVKTDQIHANDTMGWLVFYLDETNTLVQGYHTIATNSLFAFLAICVLCFFFMGFDKRFIRPFNTIISNTRRIADGNISERTETPQQLELNKLSRCINLITHQLEANKRNFEENINQTTRELERNIALLVDENEELELARKDAIEASRLKSEFIANISHEIRAPMNGIIGFTNLLFDTELQQHQRDYIQTIQRSGSNLLATINNLLDYSKIEAGRLEIDYIPMDIREVIEEVLQILAPLAQTKNLELIGNVEPKTPFKLIGDPLRIKQILTNLISNAIKFTEEGYVNIVVTVVEDSSENLMLKIAITDTGPGIAPEQQKQLFQAFAQGNSQYHKHLGTGLGLVISKRLTQLMGGDIGIISKPGQGATFWFTFACDKITTAMHEFTYKRLANINVLVWDICDAAQIALVNTLSFWNLNITQANSLDEVKNLLQKNSYHFLLLGSNASLPLEQLTDNVIMPILNNYKIPMVIFINSIEQRYINVIMAHGAAVCLPKPINTKKLYNELCKLLSDTTTSHLYDDTKAHKKITSKKARKRTALVIDDEAASRFLLQTLLEQSDFLVTVAENGNQALSICEKQGFDIIFSDRQMPGMDGVTLLKCIQQIPHCAKTPAILMSAAEINASDYKSKSVKLHKTLTKPITLEALNTIIEETSKSSQPKITRKSRKSCIDWELALKLTGGREGTARELLTMFTASLDDELQQLQKFYQEKNYAEVREIIHRLHGGVSCCGLPSLKQAIKLLGTAVKQGNESDILQTYARFMKEVQRLQKEMVSL